MRNAVCNALHSHKAARAQNNRARLRRAISTAWMETIEPRLFLSASVSYRPQKSDGSLDTPVTFQTRAGVKDFTPAQVSLLQQGFADPKYDLFLNLTGIQGDSTDERHPNEINLLSFNWGADATGASTSGGGGGAGKSTLQELHLTSRVSKASPLLLGSMTSGVHIQDAELAVRKQGADHPEFLNIDLSNVTISSYQFTTALDGTPIEEFTLNFSEAEMDYRPQKADGSLDAPVTFHEKGAEVDDFAPTESSILQDGFHSPAGQHYFLDLDTIQGGSTDEKHANQIDILAAGFAGDNTSTTLGGGGGVGKATFQEIHFVAQVSKASPQILSAMASGDRIANAHFAAVKTGADPFTYLNLDLQDVQVSSYQLKSVGGKLLEEFTLSYGGLAFDFTPQDQVGGPGTSTHFEEIHPDVTDFKPDQVSLLDTHSTSGATNAFLHIPGIAGESTGEQNPGDIDVLSFSWGGDATHAAQSGSGGGEGVGKATLQELHVVSRFSKASPILLARLNSGTRLPEADLMVRAAADSNADFFDLDLANATVSSYRVTTASDGTLLEEYTLNFAQSALTYNELHSDGSVASSNTFQEHALEVDDFTPAQPSLLDGDRLAPNGLGLFLNIDGISGSSTDSHHQNQIDILSFGWGGNGIQSLLGSGGGVGKTTFHELHFVAPVSAASPKLLAATASGTHIANAHFGVLHLADGSEFLSTDLHNITVTSDQVIVGKNGQLLEEFTLVFNTASLSYTPQSSDGSPGTTVQFDLAQPSFESFAPTQRSLLDTHFTGPSAVKAFLNVTNIPGESTDAAHPNQIDVVSFSWGADSTATSTGGGGGVGKANFQELHIVSRFSKASPTLLARINSGQHIQQADLALARSANQGDFYTINLTDVIITSYQVTTANDGTLLEEFTLSYGQAAESYRPTKSDGTLDTPISFNDKAPAVTPFAPPQHALLAPGLDITPNFNLFLNINGVPGDSQSQSHPDEIPLLAFSWGGQQSGTIASGGGGGTGKATFQELHFVSRISSASPTLLSRVFSGQRSPSATFTVQRASNSQDFLTIRLQDVTVSSYEITTALDGSAIEEFTLSFAPTGNTTGPIADAGGPYTVNDNGTVTLDASNSSDPDPASLTYAWDLDNDGIFGETGAAAARGDEVGVHPTFNAAGLFGPAIFNVSVRITDGAGLTDTASSSVRIVDVTPPDTTILTGPPALTNQTTATFTFTGSDQGTPPDQLTFTAQLDGGTPFAVTSPLTLSSLTDGQHTLKVVATDQAGNSDPTPATFTWKVDSHGPVIINPSAFPSPDRAGFPVLLSATVSDVATGNSNITSAQFSLNGTTWFNMFPADFKFNEPSELVVAILPPLPPGIYTVSFRGTDAAGNIGPISTLTLPVFDRHSKINGSGTFTSPAGADPVHPASTGTASFDIDARYKGNDNTPSGQVTFQFGSLKFQSTSLDYLVVTDDDVAHLVGSGKINGQGDYAFEITALEGQNGKKGMPDLFRIRIVNKANNQVVYDNNPALAPTAPPITPLKTGKIKIDD